MHVCAILLNIFLRDTALPEILSPIENEPTLLPFGIRQFLLSSFESFNLISVIWDHCFAFSSAKSLFQITRVAGVNVPNYISSTKNKLRTKCQRRSMLLYVIPSWNFVCYFIFTKSLCVFSLINCILYMFSFDVKFYNGFIK